MGRSAQIPAADMEALGDFVLQLSYPPNPIRQLDDSLTPDQKAGESVYLNNQVVDGFHSCTGCHPLDPDRNREFGVARPGVFGADGTLTSVTRSIPQMIKVPHLRNLYQKIGMFGMAETTGMLLPPVFEVPGRGDLGTGETNAHRGDQIRGFGVGHDGGMDTIYRFASGLPFIRDLPGFPVPNPGGYPLGPAGNRMRRQVEQFALVFPTNLKPVVGQQVTLTARNRRQVSERLALLESRADAGDCELVAHGEGRGYLYLGLGWYQRDRAHRLPLRSGALARSAEQPNRELTFTCAPPGSGRRLGIDRDEDGVLDGDE
jgi:hypothetical protein